MLYKKYNDGTYINKQLYADVCRTGDLRPVWAKANHSQWDAEYEPYLELCTPNCPICSHKLNYGLGKNIPAGGKSEYETPSTDHIIPRSRGGTNDIANLWIICMFCNRAKNNATVEDAIRYRNIAMVLEGVHPITGKKLL